MPIYNFKREMKVRIIVGTAGHNTAAVVSPLAALVVVPTDVDCCPFSSVALMVASGGLSVLCM